MANIKQEEAPESHGRSALHELPTFGARRSLAPPDLPSNPSLSNTAFGAQDREAQGALLQFKKGGMYLRDFSIQEFTKMGRHLMESLYTAQGRLGRPEQMYVDVEMPDRTTTTTNITFGITEGQGYSQGVQRYFQQPQNHEFRLRPSPNGIATSFDQRQVSDLKVVFHDVGYYYVSAGWDGTADVQLSSLCFKEALDFLYMNDIPSQLEIHVPGFPRSFLLDETSELEQVPLGEDILSAFATLADRAAQSNVVVADVVISLPGGYASREAADELGNTGETFPAPPSASSQTVLSCPLANCRQNVNIGMAKHALQEAFDHFQTHDAHEHDDLAERYEDLKAAHHKLELKFDAARTETRPPTSDQQTQTDDMPAESTSAMVEAQTQTEPEAAGPLTSDQQTQTDDLPAGSTSAMVEVQTQTEPEASQSAAIDQAKNLEKLQYCDLCLKSIDKMSTIAKGKHVAGCGTTLDAAVHLTAQEAKQERQTRKAQNGDTESGGNVGGTRGRKRKNASNSDVVPGPKKTRRGTTY